MRADKMILLDTATENLPGEKWKPVPGFGGKYRMSSYGRVKSMKPDGCRLLRPHTARLLQDPQGPAVVQVELHRGGRRCMLSVARMVYHLFSSRLDVGDRSIVISHKDGNKLNCFS